MKKFLIVIISLFVYISLFSQSTEEKTKKGLQKHEYSESEQMFAIGIYYFRYGDFKKALKTIEKAKLMKLSPVNNIACDIMKAQIYVELNDFDKALESVNNALEEASYSDDGVSVESFRLIVMFKAGKDIEKEKKSLLKKWENKSGNISYQYLLCYFLLHVEDYKSALSAIKTYDIMINHEKRSAQYIFYAYAYFGLKNYKKALENIKKAEASNFHNEYSYYWHALISYKLGNKKEAFKFFELGIKTGWDYHDVFAIMYYWYFPKENIKLLEKMEKERNLLMGTAQNGYLNISPRLIEKGANIHVKKTDNYTILRFAIKNWNLKMIKYLIEEGADINAKDKDDYTILMYAVSSDNLEIIKYLIEKGADINAKDKNGTTALLLAVMSGHLEIVKYLIEKGADINAKDKNSRTALMYVAGSGNLEIVKYLIEKGVEINVRNKRGLSALDYAKKGKFDDVVAYLRSLGAK